MEITLKMIWYMMFREYAVMTKYYGTLSNFLPKYVLKQLLQYCYVHSLTDEVQQKLTTVQIKKNANA